MLTLCSRKRLQRKSWHSQVSEKIPPSLRLLNESDILEERRITRKGYAQSRLPLSPFSSFVFGAAWQRNGRKAGRISEREEGIHRRRMSIIPNLERCGRGRWNRKPVVARFAIFVQESEYNAAFPTNEDVEKIAILRQFGVEKCRNPRAKGEECNFLRSHGAVGRRTVPNSSYCTPNTWERDFFIELHMPSVTAPLSNYLFSDHSYFGEVWT